MCPTYSSASASIVGSRTGPTSPSPGSGTSATTAAATLIWTAAIFSAFYRFGMRAATLLGDFTYLAAILAIGVMLAASTLCARFVVQRLSAEHV